MNSGSHQYFERSCQTIQIRPHHIGDTAYLVIAPNFVAGHAFLMPSIAECFQGDIKADLVAVFEAVGDGLCDAGDSDGYTIRDVLFNTFSQRVT